MKIKGLTPVEYIQSRLDKSNRQWGKLGELEGVGGELGKRYPMIYLHAFAFWQWY